MYRFLKTLHLLGLTLFLGSVLGHIVASRVTLQTNLKTSGLTADSARPGRKARR
ncbi:MAG: hypothetical protein J0H99_08190 [Rhodospirillales bacterium]|nr:hypothetical protein [Rhodospirillales bacterium]